MNDRQVHLEHFECSGHRVTPIKDHPAWQGRRKSDHAAHQSAFEPSGQANTSGSKWADFLCFWVPITVRLAIENAYRSVNWWGLFVLAMCALSSALVTVGLMGWSGYDFRPLVALLGFR